MHETFGAGYSIVYILRGMTVGGQDVSISSKGADHVYIVRARAWKALYC